MEGPRKPGPNQFLPRIDSSLGAGLLNSRQSPFECPPFATRQSVLDRYHRLRETLFIGGRQGEQTPARTPNDFASTTRHFAEVLNSSELPYPGTPLHLTQGTQKMFKSPPLNDELGTETELEARIVTDDEEICSPVYNLERLNKDWLGNGWQMYRTGPQEVRTNGSTDSDSETDIDEIRDLPGPSLSSPPLTLIPKPPYWVSRNRVPSSEELVAMLRNGQFSVVCTALQAARTTSDERLPEEDHVLYWDPAETVDTEWTDYTDRGRMMHRRQGTFQTAYDTAIGSSFRTCEPLFEDDSDAEMLISFQQRRLSRCSRHDAHREMTKKIPSPQPPASSCVAVITRIEPEESPQYPPSLFSKSISDSPPLFFRSSVLSNRQSGELSRGPLGFIRRLCRVVQSSREVMDIAIVEEEGEEGVVSQALMPTLALN